MTHDTNTYIPWNTLKGTPIDRHIVLDVGHVGQNGFVIRKTTAFKFFWWIIVNTVGADLVPSSTWIGRILLTLVDVFCAVNTLESIWAFLPTSEKCIFLPSTSKSSKIADDGVVVTKVMPLGTTEHNSDRMGEYESESRSKLHGSNVGYV